MEENKTPAQTDALRASLLALRQELKEREKAQTGHTPAICSDEIIDEMLRLKPKKPTDFYSIVGLGDAFVEKYAGRFLEVTLRRRAKGAGG